MTKALTSTAAHLQNLFDDDSDLTELSDSDETPPSTFEDRLDTRLPDRSMSFKKSSIPHVTYRSRRKFPKKTLQEPASPTPSTEIEIPRRITKRTRPESASPVSPVHVKRRKVEKTSPSTPEVYKYFASPTPATLPLQVSSSSELNDTFGDKDVVWVKVDLQGGVVQSDGEGDSFYWWPAQILEDDPVETTVKLFGKPRQNVQAHIRLRSTSSIIISFRSDGQLRFDESSFYTITHEDPECAAMLQECIREWRIALTQALQVEKEDTLPDASSLIYEVTPSKKKSNLKREVSSSQGSLEPHTSISTLPVEPPDESVKIGEEDGELVLASDRRNRLDHWPARVVGRSFDQRTKKWLYEVCYMDGGRQKVERSRFFTYMERGFASCRIGQWKTIKPPSSDDSDDEDEMNSDQSVNDPPSPSPSNPELPDIQDTDEFFDRPLSYQMEYVYPILCRVIRREYPPAVKFHQAFIKGGKAKQGLVQFAANYGQFSENEVKKIANLLRKAMLGNERWGERIFEDEMNHPQLREGKDASEKGKSTEANLKPLSSKGRPRGCEEYENLSRADRGLYSTDVLLHVAILQLHLLRSGERRSWKLKSEDQENALYSKGLELMTVRHDNHWMNEIIAMRQIAESRCKKKESRKANVEPAPSKAGHAEGNRNVETEETERRSRVLRRPR